MSQFQASPPPPSRIPAITLLAAATVVAGCSSVGIGSSGTPTGPASPPAGAAGRSAAPPTAPGEPPGTATPTRPPVPSIPPPTNSAAVDTSAIPEATLQAIFADAAARTGTTVGPGDVIRAEPTTWPDGSLGCPVPGQAYTQALVSGYWVVLRVAGLELDYRATARGGIRFCEGSTGPAP